MSRAAQHSAQAGPARVEPAIIQPGRNCWRARSRGPLLLHPGCAQTISDWCGRRCSTRTTSVFILGWDIASTIDLVPGLERRRRADAARRAVAFISKRRPQLRVYILIWDYGSLYTLEREPLTRWRLRWRMPRRVRFGFDDHHPVGASHHQKIDRR